jgi:hypothetical protein
MRCRGCLTSGRMKAGWLSESSENNARSSRFLCVIECRSIIVLEGRRKITDVSLTLPATPANIANRIPFKINVMCFIANITCSPSKKKSNVLGFDAVTTGKQLPTFRNTLLSSPAGPVLGLFGPEDEGSTLHSKRRVLSLTMRDTPECQSSSPQLRKPPVLRCRMSFNIPNCYTFWRYWQTYVSRPFDVLQAWVYSIGLPRVNGV